MRAKEQFDPDALASLMDEERAAIESNDLRAGSGIKVLPEGIVA